MVPPKLTLSFPHNTRQACSNFPIHILRFRALSTTFYDFTTLRLIKSLCDFLSHPLHQITQTKHYKHVLRWNCRYRRRCLHTRYPWSAHIYPNCDASRAHERCFTRTSLLSHHAFRACCCRTGCVSHDRCAYGLRSQHICKLSLLPWSTDRDPFVGSQGP